MMLENRSFDHVLGWMTRGGEYGDDRVDGIYGSECNPVNIDNKTEYICVNDEAKDLCGDPDHSFGPITE